MFQTKIVKFSVTHYSVSGAIVRMYVANSEQTKTCLRKRKGVVRRKSGVKKGGRSGECESGGRKRDRRGEG